MDGLPIGLSEGHQNYHIPLPYSCQRKRDIAPLLKKRNKFDHKGTFGHGLLLPDRLEKWELQYLAQVQHCEPG